MVMKLQAFTIYKYLRWFLIFSTVITLDSALKNNKNYYQEVFLKDCKYIEKKVIRHVNDNLSDFSSFDESDEE